MQIFVVRSFGARLAEERKRLGLKQADFAALVGTDVPKQSLYENDHRELRAEYLCRLAEAEVDVMYVLTGHRNAGVKLSEHSTRMTAAYLCLPEATQRAFADLMEVVRQEVAGAEPRARCIRYHN